MLLMSVCLIGLFFSHGGGLPARTRPQGSPPPPPLRTSKWLYGSMDFVGTRGAGDFILGIRQGGIFLFYPMCLYSKYSECCVEINNG